MGMLELEQADKFIVNYLKFDNIDFASSTKFSLSMGAL